MINIDKSNLQIKHFLLIIPIVIITVWLFACTGSNSYANQSYIQTTVFEQVLSTARAEKVPTLTKTSQAETQSPSAASTQTPTAQQSKTITPTSTTGPSPTQPTQPPPFESQNLNPIITPQAYIDDYCEYLRLRWDPEKSEPGTVVMPVMYHSITADYNELAKDGSQIHESDLREFIRHAKELGFETITTEQLVRFLEQNDKIPKRSMIMILDDRRPGSARVTFYPYLIENNWTLTLGWLIGDTDQKAASYIKQLPDEPYKTLWEQIEAYYALGVFDVQAHGYIHNVNASESSTDEFLYHEIADSRTVLQEHFYCKDQQTGEVIENCQTDQPLAYIWPGGSFTKRAAEIARESGYHIGFTINPRGPIMFNWIPLAYEKDLNSPLWLPEISVDDPLMVLPRYWGNDAMYRLDDVARISKEMSAYTKQYKDAEKAYLKEVCNITYEETVSP